jgi:hypothetical protein
VSQDLGTTDKLNTRLILLAPSWWIYRVIKRHLALTPLKIITEIGKGWFGELTQQSPNTIQTNSSKKKK